MTKAVVNVFLKEGVLDPQGKAAHHACLLYTSPSPRDS